MTRPGPISKIRGSPPAETFTRCLHAPCCIAALRSRELQSSIGSISKSGIPDWGVGRQGEIEEERDMVSKREVVPQDEGALESCLHCEINDLVQEHVDGLEQVDVVAMAAKIAESLVDFILLAPQEDQAKLLAATILQVGEVFLEKSGAIGGGSETAH
jgi:hypothetical protein